tara:strand:- start:91 stop:339 length:249 start_codon:yes stop_codon:yes gene_type:complete
MRTTKVKPLTTPYICGKVLRRPKFAPETDNKRLLGPGVIAVTKANTENDTRFAMSNSGRPDFSIYLIIKEYPNTSMLFRVPG